MHRGPVETGEVHVPPRVHGGAAWPQTSVSRGGGRGRVSSFAFPGQLSVCSLAHGSNGGTANVTFTLTALFLSALDLFDFPEINCAPSEEAWLRRLK